MAPASLVYIRSCRTNDANVTATTLKPSLADSANADTTAFAVVRDVCRRHARSFYFASHFLPRAKREAAYAVYAFCRMVDDAIDADDAAIESAAGLRDHPAAVMPYRPGPATVAACTACGPTDPLDARLGMFRDRLDDI